jgi:hypothetical protein
MITHDPRWSLPRGNTLVPSRWQATPPSRRLGRRGEEAIATCFWSCGPGGRPRPDGNSPAQTAAAPSSSKRPPPGRPPNRRRCDRSHGRMAEGVDQGAAASGGPHRMPRGAAVAELRANTLLELTSAGPAGFTAPGARRPLTRARLARKLASPLGMCDLLGVPGGHTDALDVLAIRDPRAAQRLGDLSERAGCSRLQQPAIAQIDRRISPAGPDPPSLTRHQRSRGRHRVDAADEASARADTSDRGPVERSPHCRGVEAVPA